MRPKLLWLQQIKKQVTIQQKRKTAHGWHGFDGQPQINTVIIQKSPYKWANKNRYKSVWSVLSVFYFLKLHLVSSYKSRRRKRFFFKAILKQRWSGLQRTWNCTYKHNYSDGKYSNFLITTSCFRPFSGPMATKGKVQRLILALVLLPGAGITTGSEDCPPSFFILGGWFKSNSQVAIGVAVV